MVPILIFLICIGWRILKRKKAEEAEENDILNIKTRPIDPDESVRINSDDDSIPYKKDITEDSPEPTEPVRVIDNDLGIPYNPSYEPPITTDQERPRQWAGETEIN